MWFYSIFISNINLKQFILLKSWCFYCAEFIYFKIKCCSLWSSYLLNLVHGFLLVSCINCLHVLNALDQLILTIPVLYVHYFFPSHVYTTPSCPTCTLLLSVPHVHSFLSYMYTTPSFSTCTLLLLVLHVCYSSCTTCTLLLPVLHVYYFFLTHM